MNPESLFAFLQYLRQITAKGARLLYNMVSAAHKHLSINPVLTVIQFSTDDTTDQTSDLIVYKLQIFYAMGQVPLIT